MDDRIELTKENLPKRNYGRFILRGPLAVECFVDLVGVDPSKEEVVNTMYENLGKFRKLEKQLSIEEEKLVDEIIDVINILDKKNFAFYDDGYIEYIGDWQKGKDD